MQYSLCSHIRIFPLFSALFEAILLLFDAVITLLMDDFFLSIVI